MWNRSMPQGTTGFVISGDRAILGGNDGNLDIWLCLDAAAGSPKWQYTYDEKPNPRLVSAGPVANALIDAERAVILSKTGMVHCLGIEDGKPLWKAKLLPTVEDRLPAKGFTAAPLAIAQGILVAGGDEASSLMCLSREDGSVKWQSEPLGGSIQTTPRIIERDGVVMAWVMLQERVVGLQLTDDGVKQVHSIDWKSTGDPHGCPPLWDGKRLILPARPDAGFATFELKDGQFVPLHDSGTEGPKIISGFVKEGHVVGIINRVGGNELVRLDPDNGKILWSEPIPGTRGSCIQTGEYVVVIFETGSMIVGKIGDQDFTVDAKIGILKEPCRALLGFADHRIFARNNSNALCISIRARTPVTIESKEGDTPDSTGESSTEIK
jgi:outer membrane protein assembly factor BamB